MSASRDTISFEAFGVRVQVRGDTPEVIERIPGLLPPGWKPCERAGIQESFAILSAGEGTYRLLADGDGISPAEEISSALPLEPALTRLECDVQSYVGLHAPGLIFVHAGVVGHAGKAIVIPGRSFTGKTTLALALVQAGAVYYSDEFAVLDEDGLVHPYPIPPSLRAPEHGRMLPDLNDLRGDREPLPIGTVLLTRYQAGAGWQPERLSSARGTLGMFENTLAALDRSEEAMRVIGRGLDRAAVLAGARGEAHEVAQRLLDMEVTSPL